jgi:predicted nucleotidyltransferase
LEAVAGQAQGPQTHRTAIEERRRKYQEHRRTELERLCGVLREIGARQVILFGSAARGEAGLDSDLDLLVVLETDLNFVERLAFLYRMLLPQVDVDILAYTPEEMADLRESNPLVRRALAEGEVLL